MAEEFITMIWTENNITHIRNYKRQKIYDIMFGIKSGFDNDNRISTIFCEDIIPNTTEIVINKDRNKDMDYPFVQYKIDGEVQILKISRYHKIIWTILDKLCTV